MSQRYNTINNSGIETVAGGNMPASNYVNGTSHISRNEAGNTVASIVVIANSHPVEVDADGGLWDTTSGIAVQDWQTNILCIGT
jgi:hypothetical protein